jgi:hypothetical protein
MEFTQKVKRMNVTLYVSIPSDIAKDLDIDEGDYIRNKIEKIEGGKQQ